MSRRESKNILIIFALYIIFAAGYFIALYIIAGKPGFPLDDTWIHLRFSENLFNGYLYQYNPGIPTPGTTSPFWVILLAAGFIFSSEPVIYSILLSSIFFLAALYLTYRICRYLEFSEGYSFFITLLTLMTGRLLWSSLSGMEITLFIFITLVISYLHLRELDKNRVNALTGLLLGISTSIRPEAGLLAVIYFILTFILFRNNLKRNIPQLALSALLFLITALPYPVFSYITAGSFFPNTYRGLYSEIRLFPDIRYLYESAKLFAKDNFILLLLYVMFAIYFIVSLFRRETERKHLLLFLWVFLLPAVSSILVPNWRHHGRYLIPLIPFIHISVFLMINKLKPFLLRRNLMRYKHAFIYITLFVSFAGSTIYAFLYGWNVENINDQQVNIGIWARDNLKNENKIALNDIGAITFISKKEVFDTEGLVSPEIFSRLSGKEPFERSREMMKMIKERGINYMIIYPGWYAELMTMYGDAFEKVYSAKLELNTICGGIEMFVYKINWNKINLD